MTRPKGGLGRGLAALIPTGPATSTVSDVLMGGAPDQHATTGRGAVAGDGETRRNGGNEGIAADFSVPDTAEELLASDGPRYAEIAPSAITPNPRNPRTVFDEDALAELEHSIRAFGLLQPVVVRSIGSGRYELVVGERRWRAAERAGLATIPAIVRRTEDADLLRDALLENIHRANLNPLEEAAAYQQLLEEFDVTHEELAARLGRSRPVISNTIRLLKLPVAVQRRVAAGVLSAGHARALLSLDDAEAQEDLAVRIVAEGLSVRGTEEAVTLAQRTSPVRRRRTPQKLTLPGVEALEGTLSDRFDTKVRVDLGRRRGRIVVEFAAAEDLERIISIMAPGSLAVGALTGTGPDQG